MKTVIASLVLLSSVLAFASAERPSNPLELNHFIHNSLKGEYTGKHGLFYAFDCKVSVRPKVMWVDVVVTHSEDGKTGENYADFRDFFSVIENKKTIESEQQAEMVLTKNNELSAVDIFVDHQRSVMSCSKLKKIK